MRGEGVISGHGLFSDTGEEGAINRTCPVKVPN